MDSFIYLETFLHIQEERCKPAPLETANFGSGVIRVNGSSGAQEVNYFLTDHLGSVRVILDGSGVVKERNDYYAFGARHVRPDYPQNDNRLKYNGKEEQVTGDLDYLDYGARMYDGGLGRWFGMDPLTEQYFNVTPYGYCVNNPSRFIDLDGMKFSNAMFWNWILSMVGYINNRLDYYQDRKTRLEQKMSVSGISDKKLERLTRRFNRLNEMQSLYNDAFDEILDLANSTQLYDIKINNDRNFGDILVASIGFENGSVMISMPTRGGLELFSHELKHAYQFERGQLSIGSSILYDKHDEVEAFQRGALFEGNEYRLNNLPSIYDRLSSERKGINNNYEASSLANILMRNKQINKVSVFRYKGKTYIY